VPSLPRVAHWGSDIERTSTVMVSVLYIPDSSAWATRGGNLAKSQALY
jgi:hypothetical protein